MLRKVLATILIAIILTSYFSIALTFRAYGAEETDALTALKFIEEELRKGKILSSSITEACFVIPEGFPVELAQRLWFFISQLVSMGFSEEEMRRTMKGANDILKLPARIDYELKDYMIIPEYEEIYISRNGDGGISVDIPYKIVGNDGSEGDASSIKYEGNGTNVFHVLRRYPKKRTYLVRCVDPDSYAFTFIDLKTGEVFNKTARIKIGLFSNISQGYFVGNFLVAVPGHFEDTREVVGSQVSEFRVLLPAYDPIVVDTSISSTRVGIGDTITITAQIRNPQEIKGSYSILLGARPSDNDAFEAWAPPPGPAPLVPLYLKAKKPGVYTITIYFAVVEPSSLDVVFWNRAKAVTYTIEVLPEPPKLEIKLSSQVAAKFANFTITLVNKGGQKARDVTLFITGDVDRKVLDIGTIVGLWSKNVVTKLLSPIAKVNVTVVYHDEEGKRYANTALTTISTSNFVAPEEWRTYIIEVEGYNETKRVFIPGYQGATHLKLCFMTTGMMPEYLQDFYGVKLIPISPDGFTLTLENASDISKMGKTLNVRYALIAVKPGFLYERVLREDDVKRLFSINEDEKLEPSKIPSNYEIKLLKEEVLNQSELVTVSDEFYEWLKYNGWEDYNYKYEDIGETKWDLDKAATRVSHGKEIELVYRPLAYGGGDLVQGVLIRNYAACDIEYELEVFSGPMRASPEKHTIGVSAFSSVPLQLVQLEDIDCPVFINLKHGDRVVATLQVSFRSGKLPEFWRGFWDGFVSKGWGIIVTCRIMIIVGFMLPPKWATATSLGIVVTGIAMNILEIWTDVHNTLAAMDLLVELADVCEGRAKEYREVKMFQHSDELFELAQACRQGANDINDNLLFNILSDLALDVSWDEIRIAFGLKEQPSMRNRDYRVGYATGRVVGAIVSCAAYVTTFYMVVNRIKAERIGGKPLGIKEILRIVGGGIWNWITPAIFDALLKLKGSLHKAVDLLLGNKYSWRFRDMVGNLIEGMSDPLMTKETLEIASGLSKQVLENVPSEESSSKILDAIGTIIEHYSLDDFREKDGIIVRSIVSIWIKDGDGAIESLNSWLGTNVENLAKMRTLDEILMAIEGDAAIGIGVKLGGIADNYFNIKCEYGESFAGAFLDIVLRNPDALEEVLARLNVFVFEERLRRATLNKGEDCNLRMGEGNELKPGTYVAKIYWKYGEKSGVMEFPVVKEVESNRVSISRDQVDQVLKEIGQDWAEILVTKAEFLDYRLFFPKEFSVGGIEMKLNIYGNEVEFNGRSYGFKLLQTNVHGGKIRVNAEFEAKNLKTGEKLVLFFRQDGKVGMVLGGRPYYIEGIKVDKALNWVEITYSEGNAEYSFNLKPLSEQICRYACEILLREGEGRSSIGLKEELRRLLGYDAGVELEEGMGSKYGIIVSFDNGRKAYTGTNRLVITVPEGVSKIEWIKIVSIKERTPSLLHEVIEAGGDPKKVSHQIGEAGERIVILGYGEVNYQKDILVALSEKTGIPLNELEDKVVFNHRGGGGMVDGEIKADEDIVVDGKMVFKKGEVIAIIEMESTVTGRSLEDLCDGAIKDLRNHLQLDNYKNIRYGVAMGFSYDPVQVLAEELGKPPLIRVYTRGELEG